MVNPVMLATETRKRRADEISSRIAVRAQAVGLTSHISSAIKGRADVLFVGIRTLGTDQRSWFARRILVGSLNGEVEGGRIDAQVDLGIADDELDAFIAKMLGPVDG